MKRDFSEENLKKLKEIIEEVKDNRFGGLLDKIGDFFLGVAEWLGLLNINRYLDDIDTFHRKILDKNNTSEQALQSIFEKVWLCDEQYGKNIQNINTASQELVASIQKLAEIITPGQNFTGLHITRAFNDSFDGYENQKKITIEYAHSIVENLEDDTNEEDHLKTPEEINEAKKWFNECADKMATPKGTFILNALQEGGRVCTEGVFKIPQFKSGGIGKNGQQIINVYDADFYKSGSGGIRRIYEGNLLKRTDHIGRAYKADYVLKTAGNLMTVFDGATSFYNEYKRNDTNNQWERIGDASVDATVTVAGDVIIDAGGVILGTGAAAALGTIGAPVAVIVGAGVGISIGVGTVVNWGIDTIFHTDWLDGKTPVEQIEDGIKNITKDFGYMGNTIAGWWK